jgi:hypothetical protein
MLNRAFALVAAGVVLAGACSSSTRTVVVAPEPRRAPGPSTAATLGVPPGHLPDIGECRVWIPGVPPGQQPRPKSRPCAGITAAAPAGSWIVYRPTRDKKLVHVRYVDARIPGTVTIVRIFDVDSGRLMRETRPEDEPQDETRNDDRRNERPSYERPSYEPAPPPPPPANRPSERPAETAHKLDIPRGHLPDPGECRVWAPGTPPGQQAKPKSRSCDGIAADAPAGSWILYRPAGDVRVVHVRLMDPRRAGSVIRTRIFDIETTLLVREENP